MNLQNQSVEHQAVEHKDKKIQFRTDNIPMTIEPESLSSFYETAQ